MILLASSFLELVSVLLSCLSQQFGSYPQLHTLAPPPRKKDPSRSIATQVLCLFVIHFQVMWRRLIRKSSKNRCRCWFWAACSNVSSAKRTWLPSIMVRKASCRGLYPDMSCQSAQLHRFLRKGGASLAHARMQLFAYSWKLPAYSWASWITNAFGSFLAYNLSFCAYSWSFLAYNWNLFTYNGKMRLIGTYNDCKQRSSTVSKQAPTACTKAFPACNVPPHII